MQKYGNHWNEIKNKANKHLFKFVDSPVKGFKCFLPVEIIIELLRPTVREIFK